MDEGADGGAPFVGVANVIAAETYFDSVAIDHHAIAWLEAGSADSEDFIGEDAEERAVGFGEFQII